MPLCKTYCDRFGCGLYIKAQMRDLLVQIKVTDYLTVPHQVDTEIFEETQRGDADRLLSLLDSGRDDPAHQRAGGLCWEGQAGVG